MEYLFVASLWIAYCALHSYLISISFTNLMNRLLKKYYAFYRIFYVVISVVLLIPIINYAAQLNDKVIITYGPLLNMARYLLVSGSLIMFFWPFFFSYDSLSFIGIRQIINFGKMKKSHPSEEIRRNGLLGIVRHPMYFAVIIFLWSQTFRVQTSLEIQC